MVKKIQIKSSHPFDTKTFPHYLEKILSFAKEKKRLSSDDVLLLFVDKEGKRIPIYNFTVNSKINAIELSEGE